METAPLAAVHADVSLWALFMQASWVVKLVMIGLLGASVWTWAMVVEIGRASCRERVYVLV